MLTLEERIAREPVKRYVTASGNSSQDIVQQRTYEMEYLREYGQWQDLMWIKINDPVRWNHMLAEEQREGRPLAKENQ